MKRIIASVLLFIIFYNLAGYYVFYCVMKLSLKEISIAVNTAGSDINIEKIKLQLIDGKINEREFELLEANEFIYMGKIYDVIRKESGKDFVIYYCVNDRKEDNLRSYLYSCLEKKKAPGKITVDLSKSKLKKCLTNDVLNVREITPSLKIYFITHKFISASYFSNVSPPPRII